MDTRAFFRILPQFLVLFPSAASCYFSAHHQMRFSVRTTALLCGAVLVPCALGGTWLCCVFSLDANVLLLPMLAIYFFLFRHTVALSLPKALSIYTGVCAVQSFPSNFATMLDAYLYPDGNPALFSTEAGVFQLLLACAIAAAAAYPSIHSLADVVDQLDVPPVWYILSGISIFFLAFNLFIGPVSYTTLRVGRIGYLFPTVEAGALGLLVMIYLLFYRASFILLAHSQLKERAHLLEMQARQYKILQTYLRETARLRHDFRHSARLLASLAEKGDLDSIRAHLAAYVGQLNPPAPAVYCQNAALNALFSYYHELAGKAHTRTDWRLELPNPLTFSELDLAALFGNLIENALEGCQRVPEKERYFCLTTELCRNGDLYIVSTNRFDGRVLKGKNGYLSTKRDGSGIGLASITAVAEKYRGATRVSHSSTEFFVDIVLRG